MHPKLSIITINLDNKIGLTKTINSIYTQNYSNYEHIIIDGSSSDGSKDIIDLYKKKNEKLSYWVSEPDNGIYNAMNKGIMNAKGEYLLFLNSGDFLESQVLNKIEPLLTGEDLIYGNLNFISPTGEMRMQEFPAPPFGITELLSPSFYLPHPSTFIKRKLLKRHLYNEQYKIISDWEFWLKAIIFENCSMKYINICITNFLEGGISSNISLISKEREQILSNLFPPLIFKGLQELDTVKASPLYEYTIHTINNRKRQLKIRKIIHIFNKLYEIFEKKRK